MNYLYEENGYEHIILTHNCNNKIICKYGLEYCPNFAYFNYVGTELDLKLINIIQGFAFVCNQLFQEYINQIKYFHRHFCCKIA